LAAVARAYLTASALTPSFMCCAQWAALNGTGLCAKSTAYDRFLAAGVFLKLWQVGVERFDELKGIDWAWLSSNDQSTAWGEKRPARIQLTAGRQGSNGRC
jgi:hypothetical protein